MDKEIAFLKYGDLPFEGLINAVLGCFLGVYLGTDLVGRSERGAVLTTMDVGYPIAFILLYLIGARFLAVDLALWRWKDVPMGLFGLVAGAYLLTIAKPSDFYVAQGVWPILVVWAIAYAFMGLWASMIKLNDYFYDRLKRNKAE